jgi:hypothetical protein
MEEPLSGDEDISDEYFDEMEDQMMNDIKNN